VRALAGVVIGAGDRGRNAYVPYLLRHPAEARIVAVAEPIRPRREAFARRHGLAPEQCFDGFEALFAEPPRADFALVATSDSLHVEPALLALQQGWHVLLEKPMATCAADCRRLVKAAEASGRILQVCHVLRYAPFWQRVAEVVHGGDLGELVRIEQSENVSYWHYAHSYCRGNWRNVGQSSPMILAKSCHDLDLLAWLAGAAPVRIASSSRPSLLCAANAPEAAPLQCIDGCPHAATCPYDAASLYLHTRPLIQDLRQTQRPRGLGALIGGAGRTLDAFRHLSGGRPQWTGWPVSAITDDLSRAGIETALRTTRYGRCVYRVGDNDQVSSQHVDVVFANGVHASFGMHGHSHREGRSIRIDGTRGTLVGRFHLLEQTLDLHDHRRGRRRRLRLPFSAGAHGGGDQGLFAGFLAAIRGETPPLTSARESLASHLMAFAADRAAREHRVVDLREPGDA
jgi:predicted dehydrogenase